VGFSLSSAGITFTNGGVRVGFHPTILLYEYKLDESDRGIEISNIKNNSLINESIYRPVFTKYLINITGEGDFNLMERNEVSIKIAEI
jgi:hypothetical protein